MPAYQVYLVRNHQREASQLIDAASDLLAMDAARVLFPDGDIELWEGDRMIVAVDRLQDKIGSSIEGPPELAALDHPISARAEPVRPDQ